MNLAQQAKKAGMSDEEIDVLRQGEAMLSGQPADEAAPAEAQPAPAADDAAPAADAPPASETPAADAAPAVEASSEEQAADEPAQAMPVPEVPENADARLAEIRTELKDATKKALAGEISPEEFSDLQDKLSAERDSIIDAKQSAKHAQRYNEQRQQEYVTDTRTASFKAFKAEGVDYADKALRAKFDRAFGVLMADPEFADKPLTELGTVYAEAHKMVKAMIGFQPRTAPKPAAPAPAATPRQAPQTLGGLPAAAPASVQDETLTKLGTLQGEELERFYASLPKAEVQRLMKLAS